MEKKKKKNNLYTSSPFENLKPIDDTSHSYLSLPISQHAVILATCIVKALLIGHLVSDTELTDAAFSVNHRNATLST